MENSKSKHVLYLKPIQGLCNRLSLLNSAINFCKAYGHSLKVCWTSSVGFDTTPLDAIFEIEPLSELFELIPLEEYEEARRKWFSLDQRFSQSDDTLEYSFKGEKGKIVYEMQTSAFCYEGWASLDWLFPALGSDDSFYNLLEPVADLKARIENHSKSFKANIVGLHIRAGDANKSFYGYRYGCNINSYIRAIKSYPSNQQFFLATDSEKIQNLFFKLFPNQIKTQRKLFAPDSITVNDGKPYQKAAAVDLLLLAKTKRVIGTKFSTFSRLAAAIGGITFQPVLEYRPQPKDLEPLSLVVALKNRFDMLRVSINSWILHPEIEEINIVNWSSDDGFDHDYIKKLDSRIQIIDVPGQENYHIAKALNTAMRSASLPRILKVDVDHVINPYIKLYEWIDINWDIEFLSGYWRQRHFDNQLGFIEPLNGLFVISKENFEKSGGYNEAMQGYGWEDCDMYQRLIHEVGLVRRFIPITENYVPIYHNPHDHAARMELHVEKDRELSIQKNMKYSKYKTS